MLKAKFGDNEKQNQTPRNIKKQNGSENTNPFSLSFLVCTKNGKNQDPLKENMIQVSQKDHSRERERERERRDICT